MLVSQPNICVTVPVTQSIVLLDRHLAQRFNFTPSIGNIVYVEGAEQSIITVFDGNKCDDDKIVYVAELATSQVITVPLSGQFSFFIKGPKKSTAVVETK